MIPLRRLDLDPALSARLKLKTDRLVLDGADGVSARTSWERARIERAGIKARLCEMVADTGVERCMYCGDGRGATIDHFQPIKLAPLRTFDWLNHLLACSTCNSDSKRDRYPCDGDGQCLLIDPTVEEPFDHLKLSLGNGRYIPKTPKGEITITILCLNRPDLCQGREYAFERCKGMLLTCQSFLSQGRDAETARMLRALRMQPFADVLYAMRRTANQPGAAEVFGGEEVVSFLRGLTSDFRLPQSS